MEGSRADSQTKEWRERKAARKMSDLGRPRRVVLPWRGGEPWFRLPWANGKLQMLAGQGLRRVVCGADRQSNQRAGHGYERHAIVRSTAVLLDSWIATQKVGGTQGT